VGKCLRVEHVANTDLLILWRIKALPSLLLLVLTGFVEQCDGLVHTVEVGLLQPV
jgi:hypothetical protein